MASKATKRARPAKVAGKTRAPKAAPKAKTASPDVEARREVARQRYAEIREKGGAEYRRMLAAAKVRAAEYHKRQRAAAKAAR